MDINTFVKLHKLSLKRSLMRFVSIKLIIQKYISIFHSSTEHEYNKFMLESNSIKSIKKTYKIGSQS